MTLLVVAVIATTGMAPLVRRLMREHGVVDIPNHRSSHIVPVPRGGGLACLGGVVGALVVAQAQQYDVPWIAVFSAVLLAAIGFADDRFSLSATPRLAAQFGCGAVAGAIIGGIWVALASAIIVPAAVNVVNFMDGINGITSLTITCWGVTAMLVGRADGLQQLSVIGTVTVGSALGFLPWNTPVAKLFLGDVGSYLFGGLVAAGLLLGWIGGARPLLLMAPLAIYLADTITVLVKRAFKGDSLFEAHREHVYQRLVNQLGLSHIIVALIVAILSACITIAVAFIDTVTAACISGLLIGGYLLVIPLTKMMSSRPNRTDKAAE